MSPTYLSEACVAQARKNYPTLLLAASLTKARTIIPPHLSRGQIGLISLGVIIIVIFLMNFASTSARNGAIRHLRNIPSYQLHDEVELLYAQNCGGRATKAALETAIDERTGRIRKVIYETTSATRERTITVVENIDYATQPRMYEGAAAHRQRVRQEQQLHEAARRRAWATSQQPRDVRPWSANADATNPATWPTNRPRRTTTATNPGTVTTTNQLGGRYWDEASEASTWRTTNADIPAPVYSPQVAPPAYTKHFSNHHE